MSSEAKQEVTCGDELAHDVVEMLRSLQCYDARGSEDGVFACDVAAVVSFVRSRMRYRAEQLAIQRAKASASDASDARAAMRILASELCECRRILGETADTLGKASSERHKSSVGTSSTPAAKAGDGWIRCSERLPEPERNVLLYYAVNGVLLRAETIVARNCVRQNGSRYWYSPAFPLHDGDEIAWMPLPAPPKPSEGGDGG